MHIAVPSAALEINAAQQPCFLLACANSAAQERSRRELGLVVECCLLQMLVQFTALLGGK